MAVAAIRRQARAAEWTRFRAPPRLKPRPVAGGLEIKPGATVTLKPGGYHIMFVGLKQPLKQGEHFKVTLEFAKTGKVDVDFVTEGLGAMHGGSAACPG